MSYHRRMYLDGLSFLEDERDAWQPFEALESLGDAVRASDVLYSTRILKKTGLRLKES